VRCRTRASASGFSFDAAWERRRESWSDDGERRVDGSVARYASTNGSGMDLHLVRTGRYH
jgi:hypothetical protein